MCVESISFVGKYVPIDTGTETRGCRKTTQKVLHSIYIVSPKLVILWPNSFLEYKLLWQALFWRCVRRIPFSRWFRTEMGDPFLAAETFYEVVQ